MNITPINLTNLKNVSNLPFKSKNVQTSQPITDSVMLSSEAKEKAEIKARADEIISEVDRIIQGNETVLQESQQKYNQVMGYFHKMQKDNVGEFVSEDRIIKLGNKTAILEYSKAKPNKLLRKSTGSFANGEFVLSRIIERKGDTDDIYSFTQDGSLDWHEKEHKETFFGTKSAQVTWFQNGQTSCQCKNFKKSYNGSLNYDEIMYFDNNKLYRYKKGVSSFPDKSIYIDEIMHFDNGKLTKYQKGYKKHSGGNKDQGKVIKFQ